MGSRRRGASSGAAVTCPDLADTVIPLRDSRRRRRFPVATLALALACAATFVWELSLGPDLPRELARLAVSPAGLVAFADPIHLPQRILASFFLHGGWLHLIGNLAFLLVFADDVEERLGATRFLALYLGSGVVATLAQSFATPRSHLPLVGASGAIAGVLGAFLVMFPKARLSGVLPIGCLLLPLRSRAYFFLPGWFLFQLLAAVTARPGTATGGAAVYAHLAGFAVGPVLLLVVRSRNGMR